MIELSDDEFGLLQTLLREPIAGVAPGELAGSLGWEPMRVATVLANLLNGQWVEISQGGASVALTPWAAVWLDHETSDDGLRWLPVRALVPHVELTFEPADTRSSDAMPRERRAFPKRREPGANHRIPLTVFPEVVLAGGRYAWLPWRERHRRRCECTACQLEVSATKPPRKFCLSAHGRKLPPLWECLECGCGGRDHLLPRHPKVRTRWEGIPTKDLSPRDRDRKAARPLKGGLA